MSKSFGFAQFTSIAEAQRFLEPNFPFVLVPPPSHAIGGTYPTDDGSRARRVKIDFSQSANPADGGMRSRGPRAPDGANDGTRDIGSAHVSVILLRGLDVGSTLDTIADALRSSEGPGRKSAKGMKRIILVKNKVSKISLGFAFVEFVDVQVSPLSLFRLAVSTKHECALTVCIYGLGKYDVSNIISERFPYIREASGCVIRTSTFFPAAPPRLCA